MQYLQLSHNNRLETSATTTGHRLGEHIDTIPAWSSDLDNA